MVKGFFLIFSTFFISISQGYCQNLDFFIKLGIQNSPLIKDFQNQYRSFEIDSLLIKATQKPQINANGQLMAAPSNNFFGYDEAITNKGNYASQIGIMQPLFNKRINENKYKSIRTEKLSILNDSKISSNDLIKTITNQYITAYADYADLSFNKSFLKLMDEQKDILRQLANKGLYKESDFLSFLIEYQSQEIINKQLDIQYLGDLRLLKLLCGIEDSSKYKLLNPEILKMNPVNISNSPLFIKYQIDSLKILNDKKEIEMNYHPKIAWFADAGILTSSPANAYKNFGFSVGLNFSMPLYDGKQKDLNFKKLDISESTRAGYVTFFRNQYNQQMQQLNEQLDNTRFLEGQIKNQLKNSRELINIYKVLLNTGNVSITDLLNALKNYANFNRNLNQLQIKESIIISEWNYLMQQ